MSSQDEFLLKAYEAAKAAEHPWPDYAACEAALESAWGTSRLAIQGNNLFGEKQHHQPIYGTLTFPTKEHIGGQDITVTAEWIKFPDWAASFKSRMDTVRRLACQYTGYAGALAAKSGEEFVRQVSRNWSTDPLRAAKVITIHKAHASIFPAGG